MDISGSYAFAAPPDRVWELLMDPTAISACVPGCNAFDPDPHNAEGYRVRLTVALAAITGTYDGSVVLSDKVAPVSYRLTADGHGRPGGVHGAAAVTLRADGAQTIVDVLATVSTHGPIARLGQRLLCTVSQTMMDRFFACLQGKL